MNMNHDSMIIQGEVSHTQVTHRLAYMSKIILNKLIMHSNRIEAFDMQQHFRLEESRFETRHHYI